MPKTKFVPAFLLATNGDEIVNVKLALDDGKPETLIFKDGDARVLVPFDLWQRVIESVERTVEMQAFDSGDSE